MKFKRIGKKGGFVIPLQMRLENGLEGATVSIECDESGRIVIAKADNVCFFCKAGVGKRFGKIDICKVCARGIWEGSLDDNSECIIGKCFSTNNL